MKRQHLSLFALVTVSSVASGASPLTATSVYGFVIAADSFPAVRALDRDEVQRQPALPFDPERTDSIRRPREAVLPNPMNGDELVSQAGLRQSGEWHAHARSIDDTHTPHRLYRHLRIAPNFVLPIARAR
jgi:hypothetical protein